MSAAVPMGKSKDAASSEAAAANARSFGSLHIGESNDSYGQEADRLTDAVMAEDRFGPQWSFSRMGVEAQQSVHPSSSRKKATADRELPPIVQEVVRSSGEPLEQESRAIFEASFGRDLSRVRVHTDLKAQESAQAVNALAYAVGSHIAFSSGSYDPQDPAGSRLLAHELAHVVQGESALASNRNSDSVATLEQEARSVACAHATGSTIPAIRGSARGLQVPLREGPATFGNLPQDMPDPSGVAKRLVLVEDGGRWYEKRANGAKFRARGTYDFVVQKGKIWAVKGSGAVGGLNPGHTEAAAGGRVEFAGQIQFGSSTKSRGTLVKWTNASGHYAPVAGPANEAGEPAFAAQVAKRVGLPINKFEAVKGAVPDKGPQLPVFQPENEPPTGGVAKAAPLAIRTATPPTIPTIPSVGVPKAASASEIASRQRLVAQLEAETSESVAFSGRLRIYSTALGGILELLGAVGSITDATTLLAEGTLLGDAQKGAEQVSERSNEDLANAEKLVGSISLLSAVSSVSLAVERADSEVLLELSESLSDGADPLAEAAHDMAERADKLGLRLRGLQVVSDLYKKMIEIPVPGAGTVPQAQAFGMYQSVERLMGPISNAANNYNKAATQLIYYSNYMKGLAHEANKISWRLVGNRLSQAMSQLKSQASGPVTPVGGHPTPPGVHFDDKANRFPTVEEQLGKTPCPTCHHKPHERSAFSEELKKPIANEDQLREYAESMGHQ